MRALVGFALGLVVMFGGAALILADEDNQIVFAVRDVGVTMCAIELETIEYEGREQLMGKTACEPPKGFVPEKRGPHMMSYMNQAAANAGPGEYLRCRWREYKAIGVWPPKLVSYHNFEDCRIQPSA